MKKETAMFGAGCFWGVEDVFAKVKGVLSTRVGYAGGDEEAYPSPSYEQVCSDKTGYAEAVQVVYNPDKISYEKVLRVFWDDHNPTTVIR